jgi:hypothetical protein
MLDEPPAALQVLDAAEQEQLRDLLQRVLAAGGTSPAGALTEGTVPTPAAEPVPDAEATVPPARNEAVTPASGPTAPGLR